MRDRQSRTKRTSRKSWPCQHLDDGKRSQLAGESRILELISLGAPLPGTLDKLCAAMDYQIGDVVSLVSVSDREENDLYSITQSAMQFGLNVFSSTRILSRDRILLGTLQIYCCDQRRPTPHEDHLIERVTYLALVALQRYKDTEDFENSSRRWRDEVDVSAPGRPQFIN